MKKKLLRINALMLTILIFLVYLPLGQIKVNANTIDEDTQIKVSVKDADGNSIDDIVFTHNDTTIDAEYDVDSEKYTIEVGGYSINDLSFVLSSEEVDFTKELTYVDKETEYEVDFYEYITVWGNEITASESDGNYILAHEYDGNEIAFTSNVESEAVVTTQNVDGNITVENGTDNKSIFYSAPGTGTIIVKPSETISKYYKEVNIALKINNNLKFLMSNNPTNNVYSVAADVANTDLVGTVNVTYKKNEHIQLNLTSLYAGDIQYTSSNSDILSINSNTGEITPKTAGSAVITATSVNSSVTAYYTLNILSRNGNVIINNVENLGNNNGTITSILSGDTVTVNINDYYDTTDVIRLNATTSLGNEYDGTMSYNSSNTGVATVAADGTINVLSAGTTTINVTGATGFMNRFSLTPVSFTLNVEKSSADISVIYNGQVINENTVIYIDDYDSSCFSGNNLSLPVDIVVNDDLNNDITNNVEITLSGTGINFDGMIIKNQNDIERNTNVSISVNLISSYYAASTTVINVIINGVAIDNAAIYNGVYSDGADEFPICTGKDGNRWALSSRVIFRLINSDDYDLMEYEGTSTLTELILNCEAKEKPNKDHKFVYNEYLNEKENQTIVHEYFGTDYTNPVIKGITSIDNIVVKDYGMFANDDITVTVNLFDEEDNLYSAQLYNGTTAIGEGVRVTKSGNNDGNGTVTFKIKKSDFNDVEGQFKVVVYDASSRSTEMTLAQLISGTDTTKDNKLIFDDKKPSISADKNINSFNNVVSYQKNDKMYVSDDVIIDFTINENSGLCSGLDKASVTVNGNIVKNYLYGSSKSAQETFSVDTKDYETDEDGCISIAVNAEDIVGNPAEEYSYKIYIDKKSPSADLNSKSSNGNENITSYGNFYNEKLNLTLNLKDNQSGVKSATMYVGDLSYAGIVSGDIASFEIGQGISGDVRFEIADNVNNKVVYTLNELKSVEGNKVYINNNVIIDNIVPSANIIADRTPDNNGKWYNSKVSFTTNVSDAELASGIKNVKIYVNDILYSNNSYNNSMTKTGTYTTIIDNQWVTNVINDTGSYTIKSVVEDNAGNVKEVTSVAYIDLVAPVISDLTGVVDGSNNIGVVSVKVPVLEKHFNEKGNKTVLYVERVLDGVVSNQQITSYKPQYSDYSQTFTFTEDGTYVVRAESVDAAGNKAATKSITFTIDNTAPFATISGVTAGEYLKDLATITIGVIESNFKDNTVSVDVVKTLNGETTNVNIADFVSVAKESSMDYTFTEEGDYVITVNSVDASGNAAVTLSTNFTIDTMAPEVIISGINESTAYKDDVTGTISFRDNYYSTYTVLLTKTGVYYDENNELTSVRECDVTKEIIPSVSTDKFGGTGTFDISKEQINDGIYTLTVTVDDLSGRETINSITFSVNRFGSVYTFDDNLSKLVGSYVTGVNNNLVINEYNVNPLVKDSYNVQITRDGSPISKVIYNVNQETDGIPNKGWFNYKYIIDSSNFTSDGVYEITIASTDEAGNKSETITYDSLAIKFYVDTTKPEIVSVTGLDKNSYNESSIDVNYELFDAIALKSVMVYVNDELIQTINEFDDLTSYVGTFTIREGIGQKIRFVVEDMAGNITDSGNKDDKENGNVASYNDSVTVSTNFFVRWYANKPVFVGSVSAASIAVAGGGTGIFFIRKRKIL